jgi:N-acetylneuraminate synthase/N,N'-diacetyllegionaminate synthase
MISLIDRLNNPMLPAIIIGEIGSNFGGSIEGAISMIKMVADAGCDFAKFQIFRADSLVTKSSYAHSVLKPLELNREWIPELISACKDVGIQFCASPFDIEAVDLLVKHNGAPFIKIASPEVHDLPLISASAQTGRPIIISSGLMTMEDIQIAIDCIQNEGGSAACCLHCVSDYPTDPSNCNLGMMKIITQRFNIPSGLSDHSLEISIPMAAVALGARVIEKHVTMDQSQQGPDHHFALEPNDLTNLVRGVRDIEKALGKGTNYPVEYDDEKLAINNKALVANTAIPAGTKIEEHMLAVKRVPSGIRPKDIGLILGKTNTYDLAEDDIIDAAKIR